jgi:hypothetical protein
MAIIFHRTVTLSIDISRTMEIVRFARASVDWVSRTQARSRKKPIGRVKSRQRPALKCISLTFERQRLPLWSSAAVSPIKASAIFRICGKGDSSSRLGDHLMS